MWLPCRRKDDWINIEMSGGKKIKETLKTGFRMLSHLLFDIGIHDDGFWIKIF
jgi:hypothetical protein